MAEDNEQRQEDDYEDGQRHPIGDRAEEELVNAMLLRRACMDVTDIAAQLLDILLTSKGGYGGLSLALGYLQRKTFGTTRLVTIGLGIEIGVFYRRNLVGALMTRNGKEVIDYAALQTIDGQLGLVGNLGIVGIEVLRHLDDGLLQQFHVAGTTDNNPKIDGFVGLDLRFINGG